MSQTPSPNTNNPYEGLSGVALSAVKYLEKGEASEAYKICAQNLVNPEKFPFLLNKFLSKSRLLGNMKFSGSVQHAENFYQHRMTVAKDMMEKGFILHPFDETREWVQDEHEVALLCRDPLSAGMGNLHEIPQIETNARVACLQMYFKQPNTKSPLSKEFFGSVSYVEHGAFTYLLVKEGLFDQAILQEDASFKDSVLDLKKSNHLFLTPNKAARSSVIERALDLSVIDFEDMKRQNFHLFNVSDLLPSSTLTLKMMVNGGFVLPRTKDNKCLDGGMEYPYFVWSEDQLKVWAQNDPSGMLLPISFSSHQYQQTKKSLIFKTLEEFVLKNEQGGLHLNFWRDGMIVSMNKYSPNAELEEDIALLFAKAQANLLHQNLTQDALPSRVKKI